MILEDEDTITAKYLPRDVASGVAQRSDEPGQTGADASVFKLPAEGLSLDEVEMSLVKQALEQSNSNQTRAAELLGISRDQLRYRLKKLETTEASVPKD